MVAVSVKNWAIASSVLACTSLSGDISIETKANAAATTNDIVAIAFSMSRGCCMMATVLSWD